MRELGCRMLAKRSLPREQLSPSSRSKSIFFSIFSFCCKIFFKSLQTGQGYLSCISEGAAFPTGTSQRTDRTKTTKIAPQMCTNILGVSVYPRVSVNGLNKVFNASWNLKNSWRADVHQWNTICCDGRHIYKPVFSGCKVYLFRWRPALNR